MVPERMRYLSGQAVYYTVMLFFAVIFIFPFIWMVSGAMKPSSLIFQYPPVIIPPEPTLQYFFDVFRLAPFGRYMFNSFFVSSTVTIVALLLHAMAGYALARLQFPGRDLIFIGILSTLMIPFYTILIPLVLLIKNLGWMDTYWALIVPAIPHAFGIFWMRQYFFGLPGELQEAARIDGASYASIFSVLGCPWRVPFSLLWLCFSFWLTGTLFYGP